MSECTYHWTWKAVGSCNLAQIYSISWAINVCTCVSVHLSICLKAWSLESGPHLELKFISVKKFGAMIL